MTGAPKGLSLTLSNWVYEGVIKDRSLLTLHPDYFALAGGVERAIYRIARKHAGDQPGGWTCRVSVLHDKTGSESPLKQFNYLLKRIVTANDLPEYDLSFVNTADNSQAIHFVRRDAAERAAIKADLDATRRRIRPVVNGRTPGRCRWTRCSRSEGFRPRGIGDLFHGGSMTGGPGDR